MRYFLANDTALLKVLPHWLDCPLCFSYNSGWVWCSCKESHLPLSSRLTGDWNRNPVVSGKFSLQIDLFLHWLQFGMATCPAYIYMAPHHEGSYDLGRRLCSRESLPLTTQFQFQSPVKWELKGKWLSLQEQTHQTHEKHNSYCFIWKTIQVGCHMYIHTVALG